MSRNKGNSYFIVLAFLFLVAILILITLVFFWTQISKPKDPISYEECSKTPGATMQTSYPGKCITPDGRSVDQPLTNEETKNLLPPIDASTNWKILQSINGYTINYPPNWFSTPSKSVGQIDRIESFDSSKITSSQGIGEIENPVIIEMGVDSEVYNLSGVEERTNLNNGTEKIIDKSIIVGGTSAYEVETNSPSGKNTTYYIAGSYPKVFFIRLIGPYQSIQWSKTVDQIISTLRFTNQ